VLLEDVCEKLQYSSLIQVRIKEEVMSSLTKKTIQKSDKMLSHNVGRNFDSKTKLRRVHMQASGKAVNKSPFLRSFILSHLQ